MTSISVLLPVFNAASTLAACLHSIQRQSMRDFECLVLDDGSTDTSVTVARQFAMNDSRFRHVEMPHRGIVATMNEGLALCQGEFVARMDADDLMLRRRLELQHELLQRNPALDGVGCHVRIFPRADLTQGRRHYEQWLNSMRDAADVRSNIFVECPLAHPTWLIRKDLYLKEAYCDGNWPEDYELLGRWHLQGHRFGVVPKQLLLWRDGPSRLSRCDARYGLDRFTELRAHFLIRGPLRDESSYVLWGYGDTGKALKKALAKFDRRPRKIVELHPGRIGQVIDGAPVVHPDAIEPRADMPLLVSVSGSVPRQQIRTVLQQLNMVEAVDYFCCA